MEQPYFLKIEKSIIKQKIKDAVKSIEPSAEVILFGSMARESETELSDWDVLILLNKEKINYQIEQVLRNLLFEIELEIEQPISIHIYTKNDWYQKSTPLSNSIYNEGILL